MTEAWAHLQRGWGALRQLSPSTSKAGLRRPGGAERPLAAIASKSLISSGGPEMGSQLANVEQGAEVWFRKRGVGGGRS